MEREYTIPDMIVRRLVRRNRVLTVSHEEDHLLRRFGQVDLVEIAPHDSLTIYRIKADEVWVVDTGSAVFNLLDRREDSPGFGEQVELKLSGSDPRAVLIPFGVECRISTVSGARCVRVTTHHNRTDPGDDVPG